MRTSHLEHTSHGVFCKLCLKPFPLPGKIMADPHRTLEAKERIAKAHICGGTLALHRADKPKERPCRVPEVATVTSIDDHWRREITRLFPSGDAA